MNAQGLSTRNFAELPILPRRAEKLRASRRCPGSLSNYPTCLCRHSGIVNCMVRLDFVGSGSHYEMNKVPRLIGTRPIGEPLFGPIGAYWVLGSLL